ncbi:hypothetical protein [Candidatus Odyssella acanthamoebae]|nr:hypothetical protein [Candidatus Paracaedibacter acanthamoebae]
MEQPSGGQENNIVAQRKMYLLSPDCRTENQIMMIKGLSSITEYKKRPIIVVRLIDDSEIPFYRSTGINSGLPAAWLPFFGLHNDGWFNKHYTFTNDDITDFKLDPLYHSGCYVLAQVATELDRLNIGDPHYTPKEAPISRINCWIGTVNLTKKGYIVVMNCQF